MSEDQKPKTEDPKARGRAVPGATIEQTTPERPVKERPEGEVEYVVHIDQKLPRMRGRAVRAVLDTGKRLKLYPSTIVKGSGVNICWLNPDEVKQLQKTPGITFCQPRIPGTQTPTPAPPPVAKPKTSVDKDGNIEVEHDEPDSD